MQCILLFALNAVKFLFLFLIMWYCSHSVCNKGWPALMGMCLFDNHFMPSCLVTVFLSLLRTNVQNISLYKSISASLGQAAVAVRTRVCDCTHSTATACMADQCAQDFCVSMDRGSQPTTSSANSQRIYNLMFEPFAQALTIPDLPQFRFVFSGHYELAVFILDRQAH